MDLQAVNSALREQKIELPSWAFGNSGTRFKVFAQPGVPRDPYEKIADAAQVHKFTGVAPTIALHIPWDAVDSYASLTAAASEAGIKLGTINANVFQDNDYKLGSVTNPDPAIRRKALDHLLECVDVMDQTGSRDLKLWFSDGTNYPGQDSISARQDRLAEALSAVYARLSGDQRLILEYKLFEPAFYTTDVPDWGTSYAHCLELGDRAKVCVDTGHHAPGTNIEFIVAFLLRAGKLGAFDFNSRFYADDDLMVGAADPFQLFRILFEVVAAGALGAGGDRVHARPVPQHRAEDPRPDPLGDERPGGHGQGPARRHRRPGRRPAGRRRPRRARRADGRLQHRRPAAARRPARRAGPGPGSDGGLRRLRVRREDRRRASRRPAGRMGSMRTGARP
jgi:L-rhamnose isomerase/sugar isomerase